MSFQMAENQYQVFADQYNRGLITYQQFENSVNQISVYDQYGQLWMIQAQSGKWCVYQSGQWVFSDPLGSVTQPPNLITYQSSKPTSPKHKFTLVLILAGIVVICGGLVLTGLLLYKSGKLSTLFKNLPLAGNNQNSSTFTSKYALNPIQTISIGADQIQLVDSNQATLLIPSDSLPKGVNGEFVISEPNASLKKELETLVSLKSPFYQLSVDGENDGTGSAQFTLPASGESIFLLELFDDTFMSLSPVEYSGQSATISIPIYSGISDPGDESFSFKGTYAFAILAPKQVNNPETSIKLASVKVQAGDHDCTVNQQIAASGYGVEPIKNPTNFCRKNTANTIHVMFNTTYTPKITTDNADQVVGIIEKIMSSYQSEGFSAANLVQNGTRVNIVLEAGSGDPVYTPSNGTVYIPQDSIGGDTLTSELAHELAHWIQDASYNMTSSYWSNKLGISSASKWWLENSAEDMVMLYDPSYIDKNLTYYGTTSLGDDKRTPFQLAPNQWNDDLYNHAQLLKVFTCDNPGVCPISPSMFIEAINNGSFPIDSTAVEKISQNLGDYARYLLGKSPEKANSLVYLLNSVKKGQGYGETVTPVSEKSLLAFKKTGYEPQMKVSEGETGKELNIQAQIEQGGVYPLMFETTLNPDLAGYPVEVVVESGTPFYFTEDGGEIKYHDGSTKITLGPIHPKAGINGLRIVAVAMDSAKIFTAKVRAIDISGDWVFGYKTLNTSGVICDQPASEDPITPEEIAQLTAYLTSYTPTIAGIYARDSGTNSYTWQPSPGADMTFGSDTTVLVSGASLVDNKGITVQSSVTVPESTSVLPLENRLPLALASSGLIGLSIVFRRKKAGLIPIVILLVTILSGCSGFFNMFGEWSTSTVIDKLVPADGKTAGELMGAQVVAGSNDFIPRFMVNGITTANVNFTMGAGVSTIEGTSEENTVCSGELEYQVTGFLLDDGVITNFPGSN